MQQLVHTDLDQGYWIDGYDIAVSENVISRDAAEKLLNLYYSE